MDTNIISLQFGLTDERIESKNRFIVSGGWRNPNRNGGRDGRRTNGAVSEGSRRGVNRCVGRGSGSFNGSSERSRMNLTDTRRRVNSGVERYGRGGKELHSEEAGTRMDRKYAGSARCSTSR